MLRKTVAKEEEAEAVVKVPDGIFLKLIFEYEIRWCLN